VSSLSVIDITLRDAQGNEIPLVGSVTLCFVAASDAEESCLGFYNDQSEWECVDECLSSSNGQLCGTTDHFTSFAILLGGTESGCNSNSEVTIQYLTWIFLGSCIIIVCASWIAIEIRTRRKAQLRTRALEQISFRVAGSDYR
jgi:hypothetical protein